MTQFHVISFSMTRNNYLGACPTCRKWRILVMKSIDRIEIADPEPNECVEIFILPNVGQAPRKSKAKIA